MQLYIDTTQREVLTIKLMTDDHTVVGESHQALVGHHDQLVLSAIKQLLEAQVWQGRPVQASDLKRIQVQRGPGSFTGTRVGVSVANALGFALGISVNGLPVGQPETVLYASQPHITPSRASN